MNQNNISTLFGKYRCENKEKLLAELNINQTDEEELKYTLNKNQELVSSLFFKNTSEWKQDSGLMDAYKKAWPYSDMDYLKQQRDDYCFWENTSLSSKSNVTFFHPVKFIGLMDRIINIHSRDLLKVQKRILQLKCLLRGGVGYRGNNTDSEQTWCNVAVYLTIRALDENYIEFLIDASEYPWWQDRYLQLSPWKDFYNEYKNGYRPSNFWCDVLYYKSNDKKSSIVEVDYIKAQKLANQGKVVIAAWKNPQKTKDASPHFATVSPNNFSNDLKMVKVANVGYSNGEKFLNEAFNEGRYKKVKFYYNSKQTHKCDLDTGKGTWFPSINELKEQYGDL